MRSLFAGTLLFALVLIACAADRPKSAFDKPTLESYVRYMLIWGPQVKVEISDPRPSDLPGMKEVTVRGSMGNAFKDVTLYVSDDGRKIAQAAVFDITRNPFQNDLDKITTVLTPSLGAEGAPVTMVVFSDFQCPHCAQEAQELRQHLNQSFPTQVQLFFKDFPIESIHPWAKAAAMAGRCVYNQSPEAFWGYHDWMFSHQAEINAENLKTRVMGFAEGYGKLDTLKLGRCIDTRETGKAVDDSIAEANSLQVNSTPTMFINGRRIAGDLPFQNLKQIIDFEIENRKLVADTGDDCCSVELSTPLTK